MPRLQKVTPGEFDPELIPLLKEMNKVGIKTVGSCMGHKRMKAYIAIDISNVDIFLSSNILSLNFKFTGERE